MLVSVEELQAYMGGYTTDPESPEVAEADEELLAATLRRAQKAVETAINRPVERVQVREVVRADSKGYLYLRVTPVWKLISCGGTTALTPVDTDPVYTIVPDVDLPIGGRIVDYAPRSTFGGGFGGFHLAPGRLWVGRPNLWYAVEYIGGLDPENIDDIKQIIISVAARIWAQNNVGASGLQQGEVDQINPGDNRVPYLSEDERRALQRYRRRVVR